MLKTLLQSPLRTVTIFVVLMLWLFVSPITAFFWTLFLVWAVFKLDSRIPGIGAIALLVIIPIVLSINVYEWMAEQLAVYVYYLLCITVALQIIELYRDGNGTENEPVEPHTDAKEEAEKKISSSLIKK